MTEKALHTVNRKSILRDQRILLSIVIIAIVIVVSIINPKFIDIKKYRCDIPADSCFGYYDDGDGIAIDFRWN